jgi:hypothetical protein
VLNVASHRERARLWSLATGALAAGVLLAPGALMVGCGDSTKPSTTDHPIRVPCAGAGSICTFAGNGEPAFLGDDMLALDSALYWPLDVELGPADQTYVLDWQNHRVRSVSHADGIIRTIIGTDEIGDGPKAGAGNELVAPGVPGTAVNLNHPTDLQLAADGTLVLAAWHNHKVRTYDPATRLMQVSCGRGPGFSGDGGPADAALMNQPKGIALAANGDAYVLDTRNFRVRRIARDTGVITTVAGVGTRGGRGDGGPPLEAQFSFQRGLDPTGGDGGDNPEPGGAIAVDAAGRLYIADTENQRIRRVDLVLQTVETVAGDGTPGFSGDGGPATTAQLNYPRDIEIAPDGRLFIADTDNHCVRAVDLNSGVIETVAGRPGVAGYSGDGGAAREAVFHRPFGIGVDPSGDLFVADTFNNRVRRVVQP